MAVTYDEHRDSEQLRLLEDTVDDFISQYKNPPSSTSTCTRQTVFFFPGGMGSRLTRATKKFDPSNPQRFNYKPIWVNLLTPFGGARDLKMRRDSAGTFRDEDDKIIIADAALSLAGCTPHNGFITWCRQNKADLFVFPWDWRRRLDDTAMFFVAKFLPFFQKRVTDAGCTDPLLRFALVGHSFGGMIVNLILRGNPTILAKMTSAITVATPFYGYPGQLHRWFEGDVYVNFFGAFKKAMTELIASFPGLYTLHFLDGATYDNATNNSALYADTDFPPPGYPSMDATDVTLRADAYNPQMNGSLVRYPALTGFDSNELERSRLQFQQLASPLDPALLPRFYNIRGVRTEADNTTPISDTAGSVKWDWIPTSFTASDPSPVSDDKSVPGDDTQPAWTARLATNDPKRCITVKAHNIDHMFMMNHAGVLEAIQGILCPGEGAVSPTETPQPEPASDEEIIEFLQSVSERLIDLRVRDQKAFDELISLSFADHRVLRLIGERFRDNLPGIARRFISDVFKRPGPKRLQEIEGGSGGGEPEAPKGTPSKARAGQSAARKPGERKRVARKSAVRKPATRRRPRKSEKKKR